MERVIKLGATISFLLLVLTAGTWERLIESTASIYLSDKDVSVSGVIIGCEQVDAGYKVTVLTVAHTFDGVPSTIIVGFWYYEDGLLQKREGTPAGILAARNDEVDLAVIQTFVPFQVPSRAIYAGDAEDIDLGCPLAFMGKGTNIPKIRFGTLSAKCIWDSGRELWVSDCMGGPGDSGGGLFTMDGRLIGICFGGPVAEMGSYGYHPIYHEELFTPAPVIRDFLKKAGIRAYLF